MNATLRRIGPAALAVALTLAPAEANPAWEPGAQATELTLRQGTNIAAALSPDGLTLAFDLLGRIWVMPASGGPATPLTDPFGDARQPSWSPDGSRIAFQAYWDGNYHIWAIGPDGSGLRQLTTGPYDHREPHWSPGGSYIAFSSDRSGGYDVWTLSLNDGSMLRATETSGSAYAPAYSPDGSLVAYAVDGSESGIWISGHNREPRRVAAVDGAQANAPGWSPDGTSLTFNSIGAGQARLHVVRLDGTGERILSDPDEDVFPFRVSWGSSALFYTGDGVIKRRLPAGGPAAEVPFQATVTLHREAYTRRPRDLEAPGPLAVRGVVSPAVSPDGARVAFAALGDLWIQTSGGGLERLTDDPWIETDPAWSPDGTRLAYVSDRGGSVDLWIRDLESGAEEQVTEGAAVTLPSWAPGSDRIAFVGAGYQAGVRVLDLSSGGVETIKGGLNGAGRPTWSPDGETIGISAHWPYSDRFREGVNRALLLPARPLRAAFSAPGEAAGPQGAGGAVRALAGDVVRLEPTGLQQGERFLDLMPHGSVGSRGTDGPVWSPDGAWMAFVSEGVLWATPMSPEESPVGPPRRLTNEGADDPTWAGDSRSIVYLGAGGLRRVWLRDGRTEDVPVDLQWTRRPPDGRLLVRAGAVFDGRSEELRRNVDIVIEGGRIVLVEDSDPARTAPSVLDATDAVVMPGLIEMHTHGGLAMGEQLGRLWLAWGVTSIRCPACDPYELTEAKESTASGRRIGPRWFGTGGTVDGSRIYYGGAPALGSTAQVDLEMARAEALGYDMIKTYVRLSDPMQRRVIAEAHALGLPVSSHELYPGVAYGADGVEHVRGTSRRGYSTKVSELSRGYGDVVELLAASGMTLTPTVGIYGGYGLLATEDPSMLEDARVQAFYPWAPTAVRTPSDVEVARRSTRDMASLARRVQEAGGRVVVGTDSPIIPQGLSLHVEMEALVRYGGMRPVDVLRATTSESGRALGYDGKLGVVAPGALADLIVLDGDPTANIGETRGVRTVIKAGRSYPVSTLLERMN